MSAAASSHLTHAPASDLYDPDEDARPKNSPELQPHRPTLRLSPPESLTIYPIVSPDSSPGSPKSNRRMKVQPSQGDAVLLTALDGGRRPEIAIQAVYRTLPADIDDEEEHTSDASESSGDGSVSRRSRHSGGGRHTDKQTGKSDPAAQSMALDPAEEGGGGAFDLKSLAAGALAFATTDPQPTTADAGPTPPVTENDAVKEKHIPAPLQQYPATFTHRYDPSNTWQVASGPYGSPLSIHSPRDHGTVQPVPPIDHRSPHNRLPSASHNEGLPPIQMHSPTSETNGHTPLPSIRAQLGDFNQLANNHAAEKEKERLMNSHHSYPHSPPPNLPRLPVMAHHASPPISPAETYRHPLSSPYPSHQNGMYYPSSATVTPGSDQTTTPGASINEKMSIEGLTIQSQVYVCKFQGCTASPFPTQYLLNSHANVHSSARPHYCPVAGCPRSEGGKGFKRKNEMIRHGLVHDSPGYVCPFCPDREHKYPRPDNLQRHVRVHHMDKDKDDPQLRDVLAQRPDGPNKGRRRRGLGG